jgi:hypothetical protein
MTEIDNPFDGEAARLFHGQSVTEQQARDAVVLRYLKDGNTEALAHWLMSDYRPGATVAVFLSYMLQPERQVNGDPRNVVTSDPNIIPYQLIATNRHGHRGRKPSSISAERNQAINDLYTAQMAGIGKGGHDSAIAHLIEQLGPEISESAIREAIKERSPKSGS